MESCFQSKKWKIEFGSNGEELRPPAGVSQCAGKVLRSHANRQDSLDEDTRRLLLPLFYLSLSLE